MSRILLTGSSGFIGFHVARALLQDGHSVVGIDNHNAYYPVEIKERREAKLNEFRNYQICRLDLTDRNSILTLLSGGGFHTICHFAAQAGVRHSVTHPFDYLESNIVGFLNILEGCRRAKKTPRLVYASSSSVYGGITKLPFSESMNVDTPISLYAASKKSDELLAHAYSSLYSIQTIGLRFFTVYGPWGRPDMMIWIFSEAIAEGLPISVFNYGKMKRSFTHIDDIVQGVLRAVFSDSLDQYEIFNLGNDKCTELMTVVSALESSFGKSVEKKLLPMQNGDIPAAWADIETARNKLGFEPQTTSIEDGIEEFVCWYRANDDIAHLVSNWRKRCKNN